MSDDQQYVYINGVKIPIVGENRLAKMPEIELPEAWKDAVSWNDLIQVRPADAT